METDLNDMCEKKMKTQLDEADNKHDDDIQKLTDSCKS
jgi:hypothetical protein